MEDEGIAPNTVHTTDPIGMGRKSCLNTILIYIANILRAIFTHTDWISCIDLAQFPRLPFCGLI